MWKRYLTPSPQLRKWYRIRKDILKDQNNFLVQLFNDSDRILPPPLTLYDFTSDTNDQQDAALSSQFHRQRAATGVRTTTTTTTTTHPSSPYCQWGLSDDEVIGGYSKARLDMIHTLEEYQTLVQEPLYQSFLQRQNVVASPSQSKQPQQTPFLPFVRFSGTTDTRIGPSSRAIRSGFCAIRTPRFYLGSMFLRNPYNALEVTCRSDGRVYTVNLKVSSYFPEDLYQSFITIPNTRHLTRRLPMDHTQGSSSTNVQTNDPEGNFVRVILPFKDFILTCNGTMRETQRILDGPIELEHVGFTIMDEVDGDFILDLAKIRAVNYYDGMILGEDDEKEDDK